MAIALVAPVVEWHAGDQISDRQSAFQVCFRLSPTVKLRLSDVALDSDEYECRISFVAGVCLPAT